MLVIYLTLKHLVSFFATHTYLQKTNAKYSKHYLKIYEILAK